MLVGDICQRHVDTATERDNVWEAAERMHQRTVGTLVVVDHQRRPVGMLTDRDLVVKVLVTGKRPATTLVADVMTSPIETISEEASLEEALAKMSRCEIRRLPVVDRGRQLAGIVSLDDVINRLTEDLTQVRHVITSQSPESLAGTS